MKVFTSSIFSVMIGLVMLTSCAQIEAQKTDITPEVTVVSGPSLDFETVEHDFGQISQGDVVKHEFTFTNNGDEPVLISQVKAPCGCTVGDYKKEPILPGESSVIAASFNSKGKSGKQRKTLNVFTNIAEEPLTLVLAGEIEAKTEPVEQTAEN